MQQQKYLKNSSGNGVNLRWNLYQQAERLPSYLHNLLQHLITVVCGIPHLGQQPLFEVGAYFFLFQEIFFYLGGLISSTLIIYFAPQCWLLLFLLPLTILVTLAGCWPLYAVCQHYAAHGAITGNEVWDDRIGQSISIIVLATPYEIYKNLHCIEHHAHNATKKDPDAWEIANWLDLGLAIKEYWRGFWRLLTSPKEHLSLIWKRVSGHFIDVSPKYRVSFTHKLSATLFWGSVLTIVFLTQSWVAFVISWVLPLTVGFNICLWLEFVPRHRWFLQLQAGMSRQLWRERKTFAHYLCLIPPPRSGESIDKWLIYALQIIGELTMRIVVLPGDLCIHDWHHSDPSNRRWPMAIWERQKLIEQGCPSRTEPFQGICGYGNCLEEIFTCLSAANPLDAEEEQNFSSPINPN